MDIHLSDDPARLGKDAAARAAAYIREATTARGGANIILATGASQFAMLGHLVEAEVGWSMVRMFHLDEYIGLAADHPAAFRRYLQERFIDKVPALKAVHFIRGDAPDPLAECARLNAVIRDHPIDVAMVGIGENGHLAFNDPPADFETEQPFIVVELDEACRRQQLGEGWFPSLEAVPRRAISMSIRHIMKSKRLIVSVPDARKADAVYCAVKGPVTPDCPASILQQHPRCDLFLDKNSAARL
jgi:glucosamine-6-phosphate deaminase